MTPQAAPIFPLKGLRRALLALGPTFSTPISSHVTKGWVTHRATGTGPIRLMGKPLSIVERCLLKSDICTTLMGTTFTIGAF